MLTGGAMQADSPLKGVPWTVEQAIDQAVATILADDGELLYLEPGERDPGPRPSRIAQIAQRWVPGMSLVELGAAVLAYEYGLTVVPGLTADGVWEWIHADGELAAKVKEHRALQFGFWTAEREAAYWCRLAEAVEQDIEQADRAAGDLIERSRSGSNSEGGGG